MEYVKCPLCGSTAQVRCTYRDDMEDTHEIYRTYECGCGCKFALVFRHAETLLMPGSKRK